MPKRYVKLQDALKFAKSLKPKSVRLVCIDPPYYEIVKDKWDRQWKSARSYAKWLYEILEALRPALTDDGSLIMFGAIGKHGERPMLDVTRKVERENLYQYRNWITWKKRRGYGKSHDYLFCREEIWWYSAATERKQIVFNIPLTKQLRGYEGFNAKYPAKSKYKRVSNVWDDIPELMRPKRSCQKPSDLLDRLIETHTNLGDLVVDCFSGWGTTGESALKLGRDFRGSDLDETVIEDSNQRMREARKAFKQKRRYESQ